MFAIRQEAEKELELLKQKISAKNEKERLAKYDLYLLNRRAIFNPFLIERHKKKNSGPSKRSSLTTMPTTEKPGKTETKETLILCLLT